MDEHSILEELVSLLETNAVTIRREPLGGNGGGLCTVKGKKIFFVDTQAGSGEMAMACSEAVTKLVDIENIYIRPQVRQFIEENSQSEEQE